MNNIFIVENLQVNKSPLEIFFSEENTLFHIKSVLFPLEKKDASYLFNILFSHLLSVIFSIYFSLFESMKQAKRNRLKVSLRILMYDDVNTKRNSWYQINVLV